MSDKKIKLVLNKFDFVPLLAHPMIKFAQIVEIYFFDHAQYVTYHLKNILLENYFISAKSMTL